MTTKSTLKFKGKFKQLKNYGFTFHKLFANNYKVYMKGGYNYDLTVWVANGGYVEFANLFSYSKKVFDYIIENRDELKNKTLCIKFNRKTGFFVKEKDFRVRMRKFVRKYYLDRYEDDQNELYFKAYDKIQNKMSNWSEVFICKELIAELLNLHDMGWV